MQTTRVCTYCNEEKPWIWQGNRLKDGSKIYLNDKGSRWAGRRCPDCEKKRVRHALSIDDFNKQLIIKELVDNGYELMESTLPLKVKKDDKVYKVSIKRAYAEEGNIIIDEPISKQEEGEIIVFSFHSIRIFGADNVTALRDKCTVYSA